MLNQKIIPTEETGVTLHYTPDSTTIIGTSKEINVTSLDNDGRIVKIQKNQETVFAVHALSSATIKWIQNTLIKTIYQHLQNNPELENVTILGDFNLNFLSQPDIKNFIESLNNGGLYIKLNSIKIANHAINKQRAINFNNQQTFKSGKLDVSLKDLSFKVRIQKFLTEINDLSQIQQKIAESITEEPKKFLTQVYLDHNISFAPLEDATIVAINMIPPIINTEHNFNYYAMNNLSAVSQASIELRCRRLSILKYVIANEINGLPEIDPKALLGSSTKDVVYNRLITLSKIGDTEFGNTLQLIEQDLETNWQQILKLWGDQKNQRCKNLITKFYNTVHLSPEWDYFKSYLDLTKYSSGSSESLESNIVSNNCNEEFINIYLAQPSKITVYADMGIMKLNAGAKQGRECVFTLFPQTFEGFNLSLDEIPDQQTLEKLQAQSLLMMLQQIPDNNRKQLYFHLIESPKDTHTEKFNSFIKELQILSKYRKDYENINFEQLWGQLQQSDPLELHHTKPIINYFNNNQGHPKQTNNLTKKIGPPPRLKLGRSFGTDC